MAKYAYRANLHANRSSPLLRTKSPQYKHVDDDDDHDDIDYRMCSIITKL